MATAMQEETKRSTGVVQPWGVEADAPRNNDLIIQAISGCRLRGRILASRPVKDVRTGDMMVPTDQATALGRLPPIPGQQLHVNPSKLTYAISDPLNDDEDLCAKIKRTMDDGAFRSSGKLTGVPNTTGKIDQHRMKTLVREMVRLVDANEATVVRGTAPSMDEVDDMPGDYLLNPGSTIPNSQPRYEKDYDAWVDRLNRMGG